MRSVDYDKQALNALKDEVSGEQVKFKPGTLNWLARELAVTFFAGEAYGKGELSKEACEKHGEAMAAEKWQDFLGQADEVMLAIVSTR